MDCHRTFLVEYKVFGALHGCLESGLVPRLTRKVFVQMKFEAVA